jgi:tetratricopeptide (TPR) repeat protein
MKKLVRISAALVWALLFASVAVAQDSGRLNGEIIDKEGKPYPDVTVAIKNSDTGQTYTVKTDKNGKFVQLGLRQGIYTIALSNQKDNFTYGPVKFPIDTSKDNNYRLSIKDEIAATAAAHPEEAKKKEEEEDKFKTMKLHFQNGLTAMTEATDLQKQIKTVPADQRPPLQQKRTTDCETALTEFQQAEQGVGPKELANHATVLQDLGAAYECAGRYDDAATAFQKAIDLKPQAAYYSGLSTNLANSAAAAQTDPKVAESKLADANASCEKAAALDPAVGGTCYKNVGIVLSNKGRQKDAVAPLQKATQASPKDAQTWYLLGSALTALMDCKQEGEKMTCTLAPGTEDAYQKCVDIDPNSAMGKECKDNLDGARAAAGGTDTTVSKKKKKS